MEGTRGWHPADLLQATATIQKQFGYFGVGIIYCFSKLSAIGTSK